MKKIDVNSLKRGDKVVIAALPHYDVITNTYPSSGEIGKINATNLRIKNWQGE